MLLLSFFGASQFAAAHAEKHLSEQHNQSDHISLGEKYLEVENAYVRGLPPGQKNTAAFFTLTNNSDMRIRLNKLSSEAASKVEVHETQNVDGQMQMRRVDDVSLEPGQSVEFKPNGMHIMLMGLTKPLKDGDKISLRLCFTEFCRMLDLAVVSVLNEGTQKSHQHMHH
jgi:hypothetical protein